jgi:16S rRNA processing protein RimM
LKLSKTSRLSSPRKRDFIPEPYLEIGLIQKPWGNRGLLKIYPSSEHIERFRELKSIYVIAEGKLRGSFEVLSMREWKGSILLGLKTITSRSGADPFRGAWLCVTEDEAVPRGDWEFFHHQLIGLTVVTTEGRSIGKINSIMETGSNDVYSVLDEQFREILIPAIQSIVRKVDLVDGTMVIQPIEGLLEPDDDAV